MSMVIKAHSWNPTTVSIASLLAMLLIVSVVGMLGARYVFQYVEESARQHDIGHREGVEVSSTAPQGLRNHGRAELGREAYLQADPRNRLQAFSSASEDLPECRLQDAAVQDGIASFMREPYCRLELVLTSAFVLVAVLGFASLRWLGRTYEHRLEDALALRAHELHQANQQLLAQARLATIGETAAMLTHEMRNPLASIGLTLSHLSGLSELGTRDRRRLGLINGEVQRLEALLSESLDYVHPVAISDAPQDLVALLSEVMQLAAPLCDEKQIRLAPRLADDTPSLRLDREKMQQVIWNLIKNAVEASRPSGVIGLQLSADEKTVSLTISNQGEPMSDEALQHAFDLYYSTKPGGSGLGLALVKRVVEEHGGRVLIERSEMGEMRVVLSLPRDV